MKMQKHVTNAKELGEFIEKEREDKKYNKRQISRLISLTTDVIRNVEVGFKGCKIDDIFKLLNHFKIKLIVEIDKEEEKVWTN